MNTHHKLCKKHWRRFGMCICAEMNSHDKEVLTQAAERLSPVIRRIGSRTLITVADIADIFEAIRGEEGQK